jgi:hypothetical protein
MYIFLQELKVIHFGPNFQHKQTIRIRHTPQPEQTRNQIRDDLREEVRLLSLALYIFFSETHQLWETERRNFYVNF